jgi:hypothetical protein
VADSTVCKNRIDQTLPFEVIACVSLLPRAIAGLRACASASNGQVFVFSFQHKKQFCGENRKLPGNGPMAIMLEKRPGNHDFHPTPKRK